MLRASGSRGVVHGGAARPVFRRFVTISESALLRKPTERALSAAAEHARHIGTPYMSDRREDCTVLTFHFVYSPDFPTPECR